MLLLLVQLDPSIIIMGNKFTKVNWNIFHVDNLKGTLIKDFIQTTELPVVFDG